jgi:subtilisin-like proprotein convertase family protein
MRHRRSGYFGKKHLRRSAAGVAAVTIGLAASLLVWAPSAGADGPTSFSNSAAIAIPVASDPDQAGPATPYPSPITVSGMTGPISTVTATFSGLTHPTAGDVDALLVGPGGQNLILTSDVGDNPPSLTSFTNATLTFSDAAAGPVPNSGVIGSGTFKPTNDNTSGPDVFPAPAPAPSANTTLAGAFAGTNPNGTWNLYINDDNTGDNGTMAGGWSLTIITTVAAAATTTTVASSTNPSQTGSPTTFTATVTSSGSPVTTGTVQFADGATNLGAPIAVNGSGQAALTTSALAEGSHPITATYSGTASLLTSNGSVTQVVDNPTTVVGHTYCNTGGITIPAVGPSTPYASHIAVSGLGGPITHITAQLKGVAHTSPVDIDAMLVGPAGQNLTILSDVGGTSPAAGVDLTFDDGAASSVSTTSLATGTFKPTNDTVDGADVFPAPAPVQSAATDLSTFNGSSGNGTWSLYVNDDASGDAGAIAGGWCLTIFAPAPTVTALTSSANPSTIGQSVTFTATVTAAGSPVTAGTVDFSDGATVLSAAAPVNPVTGIATFSTTALAAGSHPMSAVYSGTTDFQTSTGTLTQQVNKIATATGVTSSLNPSITGQSVTFTATATSLGSPVTTGTITFSDGATTLAAGVALDAAGQASFTTSALSIATHAIDADYSGTATLATSTGTVSQVVNPLGATVTAVTSSANPATVGTTVTFSATVTAGGSPVTTGTVEFTEGAVTLASGVAVNGSGIATFSTGTLTAGPHTITATFSGTSVLATSTGSITQQIDKIVSTSALTSSLNPSVTGQSVTFTVTVTAGGSPVTTGTVTFADGGSTLVSGLGLDGSGQATFTTSVLGIGTHPITVTYSGTTTWAASNDALSQVVEALGGTTTALSSSVNPSVSGQSVTFTATVTHLGGPVTSGTVDFTEGAITLAAGVPVNGSGVATFVTSGLTVGSHPIAATFSGTPVLATSSGSIAQVVDTISTTTTLGSSLNPSLAGDPVTFTATVTTASGPVATGTVTFAVDGTPQAPVAVDPAGQASFATSTLTVGSHAVTATYSGTATLAPSNAALTQNVGLIATTTALASSANPSVSGAPVTFTATVTSAGGPVATGTVTFTVDGIPQPPVSVDAAGHASLNTSALTVGSHPITATYSGTATLAPSAAALSQDVGPVAVAGGPYTVVEGGSLALDATGSATGTGVTYAWDLNGDSVFTDATGLTPTLTWADLEALGINDGPFTGNAVVKVTEAGSSTTASATLTVSNTAPTTTITGSLHVTAGKPFTVKIGADDPSSADGGAMFSYRVDWGDGSPVQNATGPADPPFSHTYAAPGSYSAALTATDKDGGIGAPRRVTVVAAKAPTPTPTPTAPAPHGLPNTGAQVATPLWSAIALLIAGALVVMGAGRIRRPRRH